jgi:hypothetical protein
MILAWSIVSCSSPTASKKETTPDTVANDPFFDQKTVSLLSLNTEAEKALENWSAMKNVLSNLETLPEVKQNTLAFQLKTLSEEVLEIKTNTLSEPFNQPAIISRFKVIKTFVLKAHLTDASLYSSPQFKENITQILIAYNAFVNQLNVVVKETINTDTIIDF